MRWWDKRTSGSFSEICPQPGEILSFIHMLRKDKKHKCFSSEICSQPGNFICFNKIKGHLGHSLRYVLNCVRFYLLYILKDKRTSGSVSEIYWFFPSHWLILNCFGWFWLILRKYIVLYLNCPASGVVWQLAILLDYLTHSIARCVITFIWLPTIYNRNTLERTTLADKLHLQKLIQGKDQNTSNLITKITQKAVVVFVKIIKKLFLSFLWLPI